MTINSMQRSFAALLCIVSLSSTSLAAPVKRTPVKKAPVKQAPAKQMSSGEMIVAAIGINHLNNLSEAPTRCNASNFKTLAIIMDENAGGLSRSKGEFETTEAYESSRRQLEDSLANIGEISTCWSLNSGYPLSFNYNADTSEFTGSLPEDPEVVTTSKDLGSTRGITNGGVRFTYDQELVWEYKIDYTAGVSPLPSGCRNDFESVIKHFYGIKIKFKFDNAKAQFLKSSGYLVVQSRLAAPFVTHSTRSHTASLTERYDTATKTVTLKATPIRAFIINSLGEEVWSCGGSVG